MKIYLAGDLMVDSSRIYLEKTCDKLEQAGFEVFLPHRDAGLVREEDCQNINSRRELFRPIFDLEINKLKDSDCAVFLLDGQCFGTTFEMGYIYALKNELGLNTTIIGLYTDIRGLTSLDFIRISCCDFLITSHEKLLDLIRDFSKKRNA
jgi:nucleoside 2-deoxyribosyltransferase